MIRGLVGCVGVLHNTCGARGVRICVWVTCSAHTCAGTATACAATGTASQSQLSHTLLCCVCVCVCAYVYVFIFVCARGPTALAPMSTLYLCLRPRPACACVCAPSSAPSFASCSCACSCACACASCSASVSPPRPNRLPAGDPHRHDVGRRGAADGAHPPAWVCQGGLLPARHPGHQPDLGQQRRDRQPGGRVVFVLESGCVLVCWTRGVTAGVCVCVWGSQVGNVSLSLCACVLVCGWLLAQCSAVLCCAACRHGGGAASARQC